MDNDDQCVSATHFDNHVNYTSKDSIAYSDLAMVTLGSDIPLEDYQDDLKVNGICLPQTENAEPKVKATAIGWG